ncbi:conserved hypothetical protein [Neisseria gonorrhoeae]|nr:conserved hypothetical protein [Neisseria gonorrhoeae]SCW19570.1 conserved hypothetical protein [Neisseria gonorrhoeae]
MQIRILISVGGAASNHMEKSVDKLYGGLTKIRTRRRAAGSTNGTEPIRPVLGHLRESFPLSRGGATPYRFLLIHYI